MDDRLRWFFHVACGGHISLYETYKHAEVRPKTESKGETKREGYRKAFGCYTLLVVNLLLTRLKRMKKRRRRQGDGVLHSLVVPLECSLGETYNSDSLVEGNDQQIEKNRKNGLLDKGKNGGMEKWSFFRWVGSWVTGRLTYLLRERKHKWIRKTSARG